MTEPTLFDAVSQFFVDDGWQATVLEEQAVLQMAFQGTSTRWLCFAQVRDDLQQVVFYSVSPVIVPEASRSAVSEYVTRANYGLILGNFEMDFADGELRYKTSIDVEPFAGANRALIPDLLRPAVYANVTTMDRYLGGALSVIFGGISPEQAILQVEA